MARQKIEWNLETLGNNGVISTRLQKFSVPTDKKNEDGTKVTVDGTTTIIGRVIDPLRFKTAAEESFNKGKKESERVNLTYEFLLAKFVNDSIGTNFKAGLRVKADPAAAVKRAIERIRRQFPNMPEDKAAAIAAMMLDSME